MKWMLLLGVLSSALVLSGCMHAKSFVLPIFVQWPPSPPLTPYNAGYHDGCAAKKGQSADPDNYRDLAGQFEAEYSSGFSEGYALCSKGMILRTVSNSSSRSSPPSMLMQTPDKDAHLRPYERYKKKKHMTKAERACVEKRRLCFPASSH